MNILSAGSSYPSCAPPPACLPPLNDVFRRRGGAQASIALATGGTLRHHGQDERRAPGEHWMIGTLDSALLRSWIGRTAGQGGAALWSLREGVVAMEATAELSPGAS